MNYWIIEILQNDADDTVANFDATDDFYFEN